MIVDMMEKTVFQNLAPRQIHYIRPVKHNEAQGLVAEVYEQMMRDFQVAPPLTVHSPVPKLLAVVWTAARESLIAGPVSRLARETVAAAVSRINICPYCVDVHSMMLDGAGRHDLARAVDHDGTTKISAPEIQALFHWALTSRSPGNPILKKPPFSSLDGPQIIGTALLFHYINRVVNVLLEESPLPVRSNRLIKRLAGSMVAKRIVRVDANPGESLRFLPDVPLPRDLSWAKSNPSVAGAYARLAAVVEEVGNKALPEEVRALVRTRVQGWNGEDMGLSRAWVEDAVRTLEAQHRPAARLTLLVALASHQIDEGVIGAFRRY